MKLMRRIYIFSSCSVLLSILFSITQGSKSVNLCGSLATCGECIRVPNCVWCSQVKDRKPHCQLQTEKLVDQHCPINYLVNPTPEYKISKTGKKFKVNTLHPQTATLIKLRLGQPFNFSLQFKVVKNYPVDLYYLTDVSLSMRDDKDNLIRLAGSLVNAIRNITSDFNIGFGSFVDKNELTFIERQDFKLRIISLNRIVVITDPSEDCGPGYDCVTYSFRNKLPLSDDVKFFISAVNSTKIVRTSFDVPEGGFEALLQAIVCKDQIGWRDRSRRLIVFATDAHTHLAGNGKLGGILNPNDGECHLEPNSGTYLQAENQDYPSLGQISRVVKDNNINLIFAVTKDPVSSYQEFSKYISGSLVGELARDSQNVVDLVRTKYEKIASSVEMIDTAAAGVNIRYYSACTGREVQERNKCENLKVDDAVDFIISVEGTDCPVNKTEHKQIIEIKPVGMNETMKLELLIICDCPCEKTGNPGYITNAVECNYGGDMKCGICNCDSLHSGANCECSSENFALDESSCKVDNTTYELCSNRGDCLCGNCVCHKRSDPTEVISGKYCECDNFSCARANGKLCSNNGECKCGECQCNSGWEGIDCGCATSKERCIPLGSEDVCLGNGICACGSCICKVGAQGTFCQDCPMCPSKCDEFTSCVQCKVFKTGPNMNGTCDDVCSYSIVVEDTIDLRQPSERYCSYLNESNCKVSFVYDYDDATGAKQVRVKREQVCLPPESFLALALGLLLTLVLGGLITLFAYRTTIYVYDKREFARLKKESENAKWSAEHNPLYQDPTMTYRNPLYKSCKLN